MRSATRLTLYFLVRALRGLRANPVPSVVAVLTIAVSIVLVGAFALLVRNMEGLMDRFGEDLQVTAYLTDGLSDAEREDLAKRVGTAEGVSRVRSVSKEQALEKFRRAVGTQVALLEGLDENPLPASLEIVLTSWHRTPEGVRIVAEAIDGLPGVEEVVFGQAWLDGYARAVGMIRVLTLGLGAVLTLGVVLIVSNTIRLALYTRRDELEILSLVGASRAFVRTPFLLEGLIQGGAGAILALAILYAIFRLVLPGVEAGLELLLGYAAPRFFTSRESAVLLSAGAGVGLLGSSLALARGWRS